MLVRPTIRGMKVVELNGGAASCGSLSITNLVGTMDEVESYILCRCRWSFFDKTWLLMLRLQVWLVPPCIMRADQEEETREMGRIIKTKVSKELGNPEGPPSAGM